MNWNIPIPFLQLSFQELFAEVFFILQKQTFATIVSYINCTETRSFGFVFRTLKFIGNLQIFRGHMWLADCNQNDDVIDEIHLSQIVNLGSSQLSVTSKSERIWNFFLFEVRARFLFHFNEWSVEAITQKCFACDFFRNLSVCCFQNSFKLRQTNRGPDSTNLAIFGVPIQVGLQQNLMNQKLRQALSPIFARLKIRHTCLMTLSRNHVSIAFLVI